MDHVFTLHPLWNWLPLVALLVLGLAVLFWPRKKQPPREPDEPLWPDTKDNQPGE